MTRVEGKAAFPPLFVSRDSHSCSSQYRTETDVYVSEGGEGGCMLEGGVGVRFCIDCRGWGGGGWWRLWRLWGLGSVTNAQPLVMMCPFLPPFPALPSTLLFGCRRYSVQGRSRSVHVLHCRTLDGVD